MRPLWTVVTNFVPDEEDSFVGLSYEFFSNYPNAERCYYRHRAAAQSSILRKFHQTDVQFMNPTAKTPDSK